MNITPEARKLARERLIVALDVPDVEQAKAIIDELDDEVTFYKIGLRLLVQGGPDLAGHMRQKKKNIFLDYKFHDIEAQVGWAAASAATLGGTLLTVHSYPTAMTAAVKARDEANKNKTGDGKLKVVAVTILTSWNEDDLDAVGISGSVADNVKKRARAAKAANCDGVVASANEVKLIRSEIPDSKFLIVTPGIRPAGSSLDDQKRVATPYDAIKSGASLLVVGRPITNAKDRVKAAREIIEEMATAISEDSTEDGSRVSTHKNAIKKKSRPTNQKLKANLNERRVAL